MSATPQTAERLVLIGTPSRLTGLMRLSNPGTEKLKVKSAPLQLKGRPGSHAQLTLGARVAPGVTAHLPVSLQLDPRTPPGDLHAQVVLDGETRDVVLRVLEHRELALNPARFVIHGTPGAQVRLPALLTNLGNVPHPVPRVALVAVSQAQGFDQLFHVAMAQAGAKGHQAALDAFAQLLQASEVQAPKVVFGHGAGEDLAPGDALETELTFELPADLARHRTYLGQFSIGRTAYPVEIEVDTPTPDAPAARPTAPAAPRKARP